METVVKILIITCPIIFVVAVVFGKYPKKKVSETVWRKLDDHEKALGE